MKKILLALMITLLPMAASAEYLGLKKADEFVVFQVEALNSAGLRAKPDSVHVLTYLDQNDLGLAYSNRSTTYPFAAVTFIDTSKIFGDTTYWFSDQIQDIDGSPSPSSQYNLAIDIVMWTGGIPTHNISNVQVISDTLQNYLDSLLDIRTEVAGVNGLTPLQASDNIGINWADVTNQSTAVNLSATTFNLLNTVTTLTNLPSITANWLTAAGINAAALNGKGDWNIGKTGYSLTQAFPTNFADLAITVTTGEVDAKLDLTNDVSGNLVAGNFAAASLNGKGDWNIGKTGYALTLADWNVGKTGYALTGAADITIGLATWNTSALSSFTSGSMGDSAIGAANGWGVTGASSGVDSTKLSNILRRVVYGLPVGSGSDSTTLAERKVTASASGLDSATTSRILHRVVWGTSKSDGSDSSTVAERDVSGGAADWTSGEKENMRSALGIDGTKTTATGGQLQDSVLAALEDDAVLKKKDSVAYMNTKSVSGDAGAADNQESFFDGVGYAGTNNIIPTVTTLTNLPSITSNWLTAAGINAAALDGKGDWNINKTGYSLTSALDSLALSNMLHRIVWGTPKGTDADTSTGAQRDVGLASTTTNLTNLPSIPANWLTAAGINSSALDGKGDWNINKTGYALSTAGDDAVGLATWNRSALTAFTSGSMGDSAIGGANTWGQGGGGGGGLDSATTSRILHRVVWGTSKTDGTDSSTAAERDIGGMANDLITDAKIASDAEAAIGLAAWNVSALTAFTSGSMGDSAIGAGAPWSGTGSGSGLDSATHSRIMHRVIWGTSKSAGSDSSTLAERAINNPTEQGGISGANRTWLIVVLDTSGADSRIPSGRVEIQDNVTGAVILPGQVDAQGEEVFTVTDGTYAIVFKETGFVVDSQHRVVSANQTDTIKGYDVVIGTPAGADLSRIFGTIKTAEDIALDSVTITFRTRRGFNTADTTGVSVIVSPLTFTTLTDATGAFTIDVRRTGTYADTTRGFYHVIAKTKENRRVFEIKKLYVPASGNVDLGDLVAVE